MYYACSIANMIARDLCQTAFNENGKRKGGKKKALDYTSVMSKIKQACHLAVNSSSRLWLLVGLKHDPNYLIFDVVSSRRLLCLLIKLNINNNLCLANFKFELNLVRSVYNLKLYMLKIQAIQTRIKFVSINK